MLLWNWWFNNLLCRLYSKPLNTALSVGYKTSKMLTSITLVILKLKFNQASKILSQTEVFSQNLLYQLQRWPNIRILVPSAQEYSWIAVEIYVIGFYIKFSICISQKKVCCLFFWNRNMTLEYITKVAGLSEYTELSHKWTSNIDCLILVMVKMIRICSIFGIYFAVYS
jgi:hypothetical protein